MINGAPLVLRVFIYPAVRVSETRAPSVLRLLLGDSVSSLADLHGVSCNWESALVFVHELQTINAGFVVAVTDGTSVADVADVAEHTPFDSLLSTPVTRFPMSVRASNCLHNSHLRTIGEVVSLTPERILRLKNLGRTTLNEIASLAGDLGLRLGMTTADLDDFRRLYASSKGGLRHISLNLLRDVDTIGCGRLSVRLVSIKTVGELIQVDRSSLASQLSAEELATLAQQLKELGIEFPAQIDSWQKEYLSDLADIFAPELLRFSDAAAECLEVELCGRIATHAQRNRDIAISYLGLDGRPTETLEQVGERFRLTRERVRQIVDKVRREMGPTVPDSLRRAIELVDKSCPCDAEEAERKLVKNGITSGPFRLESLQRIGEMFGISVGFSVIRAGESRLVVDSGSAASVSTILSEARKRITHFGATSVTHTVKALEPTDAAKLRNLVAKFLPLLRGLTWLDDSCDWFWSPEVPRNPIVSRIKKVFMVTDKLTVEELRNAVLRDPRTHEIDLPLAIFERFCCSCPDYLRVENGVVSHASDQLDGELSESETAVFVALRDKANAVRRSDLKRICATVSDGGDGTLDRTIASSPIIKPLGEGYYTLVGRGSCPILVVA